jgi:hypothetical protein
MKLRRSGGEKIHKQNQFQNIAPQLQQTFTHVHVLSVETCPSYKQQTQKAHTTQNGGVGTDLDASLCGSLRIFQRQTSHQSVSFHLSSALAVGERVRKRAVFAQEYTAVQQS